MRIALLIAAAAAAALPQTAAAARLTAHVPNVVTTGQRVIVRGRARGATRVALEQRDAGRWTTRANARTTRAGDFTLRWRAPASEAITTVRVSARRGRRRVLSSRPKRVAVSPTAVLRPASVTDAPPPGEPGTLRVTGRPSVKPGGFVALDVGPETPEGLLARVTRARREAGKTVLETEPASIVDAVPQGHVKLSAAPRAAKRIRAAGLAQPFSPTLGCGPAANIELDGSVALDLAPTFELDWSWGRVTDAKASVTLNGDLGVTARLTGAAQCGIQNASVAGWNAPPLRAAVGPIPVVITPRTDLFVSATAEAGAAVTTSVQGNLTATAGLSYDGEVDPIGAFEQDFKYSVPTAGGYAKLAARVSPTITFLVYGQAGPRFDVSIGPQLQVDPSAATLTLPVELRAGLAVPRLSTLEIPQQTVFEHEFELARTELSDERARITWDTNADVDLHVWDAQGRHAWFEANPIPGSVLTRDDTDGFGPETFSGGPADLTYGICLFDDNGAGPTRVTVRAGGGVATKVLNAKGDHAIVGGGSAPDDDWCKPR